MDTTSTLILQKRKIDRLPEIPRENYPPPRHDIYVPIYT